MEDEKNTIDLWYDMTLEELQNSLIYKSLTEVGKKKAGDTKDSILDFFTRILFPFIHNNIHSFVMDQISHLDLDDFKDLKEENILLSKGTQDACLVLMSKRGVSSSMDLLKYLMVFENYKALNLCKFIPIQVIANNYADEKDYVKEEDEYEWEIQMVDDLFEAFMFSRLQYLKSGAYMPIVVNMAMRNLLVSRPGHSAAYVFLPNTKDLSWHRIFIDSSNLTSISNVYKKIFAEAEKSIQLAWTKYVERLSMIQIDQEEFESAPTLCSYDFQGKFSTCTHWSLVMMIHFLYNFQNQRSYLMSSDIMTKWCKNLEDFTRINRDKVMRVIIDFDMSMNTFLKKTIFDPLSVSENKEDNQVSLSVQLSSDDDVPIQIQKCLMDPFRFVDEDTVKGLLTQLSKYIAQLNILDYFSRMI
jgi:hypothetical protein